MTPVLLTTFVALVAALPPTVDHWIAQKVKGVALMAFLTALFGVFDGSLAALLSQVANGATWSDAEMLGLTGLISGAGTALVNFIKASGGGTASGGGSVTGSGIPAMKPMLVTCVGGAPPASPRVVDVKWTPAWHMGLRAALPAFAFVIGVPICVLAGLGVATEACTSQQAQTIAPVVPPVADLGACVAEGALEGLSVAQLVAKCGGDVPAVIAVLFSSTDEKVKASSAHAEALRVVSMSADAGSK